MLRSREFAKASVRQVRCYLRLATSKNDFSVESFNLGLEFEKVNDQRLLT